MRREAWARRRVPDAEHTEPKAAHASTRQPRAQLVNQTAQSPTRQPDSPEANSSTRQPRAQLVNQTAQSPTRQPDSPEANSRASLEAASRAARPYVYMLIHEYT
jgi:hypothetical protein